MRPTFMGFETATRGLMAQQKALDIVGNNVGNIGVTGYTRQRVDMVSLASSSANGRFAQNPTGRAGQGVMVTGISQIRDPFLDKRFREEYADVGYYTKLQDIIGDLEDGLNEISPSNMSDAIASFNDAWKLMQKDGGKNATAASSVLASAKTLTQVFQQLDSKVESIWSQQKYDLEINTNSVNSILSRIANLNEGIKKEMLAINAGGSSSNMPNELLDARNVLLDQLSEYGDIKTKTNTDGTVTVMMGANAHEVVKGGWSDQMTLTQQRDSQVVKVSWQSTGKDVNFTSGSVRASVDMLNGRGPQGQSARGEGFEKGILYYKDKINTFASVLGKAFNEVVPIYDENGTQTGTKQLFTFGGDGEPNAKNIMINKDWEENASYLMKNAQKPGAGESDTSFVSNAMALFSKNMSFGEFSGTFNEYITFYTVANLGTQGTHATSRLESCADIADKIMNNISAVSGVSMEEEGVDMVQYTKAYNAMGRVMTALDEALDTLINKVGLVGR